MYLEIEGLVVDTTELSWVNADINNPEEWKRAREQELDRAEERIHEAVRRFRELGLIDEHGNRVNKELPPDMREDGERDFGDLMKPAMMIVAGPPGSGKSSIFPVSTSGVDFFNADDRAAQLNGNSYRGITLGIRAQVNKEFEAFIDEHIRERKNFAFETTLRSAITFEQVARAKANGLSVSMDYICAG